MRRALLSLVALFGLAIASFGQTTTTFPKVVATFQRLHQTAAIPATTIFTPKAGGLFRITIYFALLKANSDQSSEWVPTITFPNDTGQNTFLAPGVIVAVQHIMSFEFTSWDKMGGAMIASVPSAGPDVANTEYNVTFVVEQLM